MPDQKKYFTLKREMDFGDILTSLAILVSLLGLGLTWLHDQRLKTQTYADEIRKSAAEVTGKLERWTQLSDLYFEDLLPSLGTASAEAARTWRKEPANVNMYNAILKADFESSQRVTQEQLEISYMELYRYVPELQTKFDETIKEIRVAEGRSHESVKTVLQRTLVHDLGDRTITLMKPDARQINIGNDLRIAATTEETRAHEEIEKTTRQLRGQMLCLINLPDEWLQDPAKRKAAVSDILSIRTCQPLPLPSPEEK